MTEQRKRRILIATGTRADWGLLAPLAQELERRPDVELQVLATNMHVEPRYGMTIKEIRKDVSCPIRRLRIMGGTGDEGQKAAYAMGRATGVGATIIADFNPDMMVVLGDRYEMLALAAAATVMRVPIAHISGGEITEGAIDDSLRHAITKLSSLHFTSTEDYRRRVIQMGEQPDRVFNVGALGVYNALTVPLLSRAKLNALLGGLPGGKPLRDDTILVTYHPATLDTASPSVRIKALLAALDRFVDHALLITYPNNDPGGTEILQILEQYAAEQPGRVTLVPSLGRVGYLSALQYVKAVVGNSSSGIIEVPSMHVPVVDVGIRQRGRIASKGVLHCADDTPSIVAALHQALSPEWRRSISQCANPYERAGTPTLIADVLCQTPLETLSTKTFYNLPR